MAKVNQGVVNNFVELYLANRFQTVVIHNNHSSMAKINVEVPQGSSLGPPVFLLYVNDIPNCSSSTP